MGLIDWFVGLYQTTEGKMRLFRILFWIATAFMLFGLGLIVLSVFG